MAKGYNSDDLKIDGKYGKYFWDRTINPNASVQNGLSNCTTLTYGLCKLRGLGAPVSTIRNAGNWYKNLNADWEYMPYDRTELRKNDIVEWSNHVVLMEDHDYCHCSWYTGCHGKSVYEGSWDTRPYNSLEELCSAMQAWPYRFYHYTTIEQEIKGAGSEPLRILRKKEHSDITKQLDEIIALIEEIKEEL